MLVELREVYVVVGVVGEVVRVCRWSCASLRSQRPQEQHGDL